MKVLHAISDENIGGAGILLLNLLRCFEGSEIQSLVVLPKGSRLTTRLNEIPCKVIILNHPCDRADTGSVLEISKIIRENRVDLVHANAALSARIAGRLCGVRVVFTRHCFYPMQERARLHPANLLNNLLCDAAIATAEVAKENLKQSGISQQKIHLVINGSPPIREVSDHELLFHRQKWGIEKEDFVVGICARLESCKGQDVFLKAAEQVLRQSRRAFRFLIVGEGSTKGELRRMAKRMGIAHAVTFTGFVSDMAPVYRLLDLNVNCSRGTETSCLALSEGMSAGVPMAISSYGGNGAMLGDSGAGTSFAPEDHVALAEIILRFSSNKEEHQKRRQAARERYLQYYTAQRMALETASVYREVLKKSTRNRP